MNFESFIKEGKVRTGACDIQKAKALLKTSKNSLETAKTMQLNKNSASTVLVIAYDSFRQVIDAICLTQGYRVYSHEAFTYFLKVLDEEKISYEFDRLRRLRNGVNYYGKSVPINISKDAITIASRLRNKLIHSYLDNL